MVEIAKLARTLDNAAHKARATRQLSENTKYSLDDAYDIQAASIQRRLDRGEKRNGMKMGFTSRAKMIQMGLNDMIWGRLTDQMMVEDGDTISIKNYVHPRVEPEIAFLLKRPLGYPCTAAEALSAVDGVAHVEDNEGAVDARYGAGRLYLVRPDQHVAAVFTASDAHEIAAAMTHAMGRE